MANEVLVIAPIYDFTVTEFINQINTFDDSDDICVLLNSPGGNVFAGWTFAGKLATRKGKVNIKVMGMAASMAAMFPLFADHTTALDVTKFMIHRASPNYDATDAEKQMISEINDSMYQKLKAKINIAKFKEITGRSLKDVFSKGDEVIDVHLTANEAKDIGLIEKVEKLGQRSITAFSKSVAAHYNTQVTANKDVTIPKKELNKKIMNLETLKSEHPELFKQVVAIGVSAEKDRVGSWMAFNAIDPEAVASGIKEGTNITATVMSEMQVKAIAGNIAVDASAGNADPIDTDEPEEEEPKSDEEKAKIEALSNFENELDGHLKLAK